MRNQYYVSHKILCTLYQTHIYVNSENLYLETDAEQCNSEFNSKSLSYFYTQKLSLIILRKTTNSD